MEQNDELESTDIESGTSFWRLMKLNTPEWPFIVLGCLASLILGGTLPTFAILFGNVYAVSLTQHVLKICGFDLFKLCFDYRYYLWMTLMKL